MKVYVMYNFMCQYSAAFLKYLHKKLFFYIWVKARKKISRRHCQFGGVFDF